jgi:hypothetical protein
VLHCLNDSEMQLLQKNFGWRALIVASSGKRVIVAGTMPNDRLVPTTIGLLDRRLGLISPWVWPSLDS